MSKRNTPWAGILVSVLLVAGTAVASNLTLPFTFTAGTTAKASEVNANFAAVKTALDDTQAQVTSLSTQVGAAPGALVYKDPNGKLVGPVWKSDAVHFDAQGTAWLVDLSGKLVTATYDRWYFTSQNCSGTAYLEALPPPSPGWGIVVDGTAYTVSRSLGQAVAITVASVSWVGGQCSTVTSHSVNGLPKSNFTPTSLPAVTWTGPLHPELMR